MKLPYDDSKLMELLQPQELKNIFRNYELSKRISRTNDGNIATGADGISHQVFRRELDLRCALISKRAVNGSFLFYPFAEQVFDKGTSKRRKVEISSIRDILVQKALLSAIYDEVENLLRTNHFIDSAVCSHRKGKSAIDAVLQAHRYMKDGYYYVLCTDIVQFYRSIPCEPLTQLVRNSFGKDSLTSQLLVRLIATSSISYSGELLSPDNQAPGITGQKARPRRSGIAIGGILSGILSNLYLYDFDLWAANDLSRRYNLKYLRYVDNLLFLLKDDVAADVYKLVFEQLIKKGLTVHGSQKTSMLDVRHRNLEYVDFQISPSQIAIGKRNVEEFKQRIRNKIEKEPSLWIDETDPTERFRRFVGEVLKNILSRRVEKCRVCNGTVAAPKSWIKYYSVITEVEQLEDLDRWIRKSLGCHFYGYYGLRLKRRDFRRYGMVSILQEYYHIQRDKPCKCSRVKMVQ